MKDWRTVPVLSPASGVRRHAWPAVPNAQTSRMLAVLFQLEQSQWLSPEALLERQTRQIGVLLRHACETSPYYRRRLAEVGLTAADVRGPDEWRAIPLLTREDWQNAGADLYSAAPPKEHGLGGRLYTSGSTGKPVMVVNTHLTQLFWNAFTIRDHLWHRRDFSGKLAAIRFVSGEGCDPPDGRVGANWGPATADVVRTGPSATLHIKAGVEQQADWLIRHEPDYLITYPSNILALARRFLRTGKRLERLRQVRTFGELLEPHVRRAVADAFGVGVVDMYSSQEVGYIALQCPMHEHYHVQSENVLLEVLDAQGNPCPPGAIGRIVVTALHNFATPILRYQIGDFAEVGEPCPCGRGLPVLNRIVGRQRNMLVLPGGELRWPSIEVDNAVAGLEALPPIRQFQVIQRSLEEIEALLVAPRPLTEEEQRLLIRWFEQGLGHSFRVKFTYVDHIPSSPTGKFEDFKSDVAASMGLAGGGPGTSPPAP
jgi:phenylacetate-CoA ligase